ncbi:MAG TPA: amidase family protein [Aliidongia sp.]|uniref:amidase n=1 Tax=Aliidongia sp. TaxID=1914230 RepID=UPI002DDD5E45|nr:amidase family protein [Aliidongia sp.]HEV2673991.1 amidase family protein [Aliidongia sp.]
MTSLSDRSAVDLRRLIGTKEISPVELLDDCLARIEAVNPAINAVVALDVEGARTAAREAERQVLRGEALGPLHGLPIGIKDLSETKGLRTTWGSLIYKDHIPNRDESTAAAVRAAGGIIFAKTNTPEFGAGANTRNGVYGATGNPFAPDRTPAGSSGGSAAALAAGMMPLATGSDMGGSLRTPAAYCGIVGFRPTPGLIPSDKRLLGYSPLSVDGPMGRSVADAALLLSALAREDSVDPLSWPVDPKSFFPLPEIDLARLKIAVSEDLGFAPVDDEIRAVFTERCGLFADLFQSSVERDPELGDAHRTFAVLRAESFEAGQRTLAERHRDLLQPPVRANLDQAQSFTLADHAKAHAEQTKLYRRFQYLFEDIDLLICPTAAVSPFPHAEWHPTAINGEPLEHYFQWIALTYGLTLTGHPVVALPCGIDHKGLPFGIQIVGKRRGDAQVLAAALAIERAFATRPKLARPVPDLAALGLRS